MLKIKGVILDLDIIRDEFGNDYMEGTIDCPRSSGISDIIYFRTEYTQMKYLLFMDSANTKTPRVFSGSLRTYPTGELYPRYRTRLYIKDYYSYEIPDEDLNVFNGWLEVLKVGEPRLTPNGIKLVDMTFFSNRVSGMKDKISCVAFGKTADYCVYNLEPGMKVNVTGRYQSRMYLKDVGANEPVSVTINELIITYINVSKEV